MERTVKIYIYLQNITSIQIHQQSAEQLHHRGVQHSLPAAGQTVQSRDQLQACRVRVQLRHLGVQPAQEPEL